MTKKKTPRQQQAPATRSARFIAIDGPDGAGKSTQVALLAEYLQSKDQVVITVRDPGGTEIGEAIRHILLSPAHDTMDPRTELLLYTAARLQLWLQKISPALEAGQWVISDRWIYSTCAYQGAAGKLGIQTVYELTQAVGLPWADRAIILDLEPRVGLSRVSAEPDRMESKPLDFHQAVHSGYLALAQTRPEVALLNGSGQTDQIQQAIRQALGI